MKVKSLFALILAVLVYSCDDSTNDIGYSLIPGGDRIPAFPDSYEFTTRSILADSVYARTSTAYLGRYTDEQYGEFSSDFLAQFTWSDDFEFDEYTTQVVGLSLNLRYSTFFGDSLNAMRLQVDTLSKVVPEENNSVSYTSIDPRDYYNPLAKPVAVKAYSATGPSVASDTTITTTTTTGTVSYRFIDQSIKLPTQLGQHIFAKYKENKAYFKNPETFIQNVLKGFYVHCTHGDGTILYIDDMWLTITAETLLESSSGKRDSAINVSSSIHATKEVIQANHFQNSDKLKEIIEESGCTYLKTPAGIFTEATFPIANIYDEHKKDTLNGISVTFNCYNDKSNTKYKMTAPAQLLMVRKQDMYSFFEQNKIPDNQTSFYSTASGNSYTFSNIAPLITYCIEERKNGLATDPNWETKHPDWNKVVLIPVTVETSTDSYTQAIKILSVSNDLSMGSARLKGGTDKLKMQVFYTTF